MSTISVSSGYCALRNTELFSEVALETGWVKSCKRCKLLRLQTWVDKSCKSGYVSRVENNNYVLNIWAIFLNIITELSSDLAVTFEKILTGHALFTRCSTWRNDIFGILECNLRVNSPSDVRTLESTVIHFLCYTMYTWLENIVKADVRCKTKHKSGLSHVGTDHSAGTDDGQFLISQILHN